MPRSKNGKMPRSVGPDSIDIQAALDAIKTDMNAEPQVIISLTLDGRLSVECSVVARDIYGDEYWAAERGICSPNSTPVLITMMVAIHKTYHRLDNSGHVWKLDQVDV